MSSDISRRAFVQRAAAIAVSANIVRWRAVVPAPALRIGVIAPLTHDATTAARQAGLELGAAEAQHAAGLFGGSIEMVPVTAATIASRSLGAVIGGEDPEHCTELAAITGRAGVAYINISCVWHSLRAADCRRTMFHVVPDEAMYRDAVALAKQPGGFATAWHSSLDRFGADTLNQRFRTRFGTPMSEYAWTAWFGVKILWEASLRARSVAPAALMQYLSSESTQFDGHKGRPLSFRSWDNQLRQPMYVVRAGASGDTNSAQSVTEVPVAGADESSREVLDRLGVTRAKSSCTLAGHPQ